MSNADGAWLKTSGGLARRPIPWLTWWYGGHFIIVIFDIGERGGCVRLKTFTPEEFRLKDTQCS